MSLPARATPPGRRGLFVDAGGEVRLLGSSASSAAWSPSPSKSRAPAALRLHVRDRLLGRRGTLWSWTIQCFPPKSPPYAVEDPDAFEPFGVGYVELPDEVRVEARLTIADPEKLRIGMPMELTLIPAPGAAPTAS